MLPILNILRGNKWVLITIHYLGQLVDGEGALHMPERSTELIIKYDLSKTRHLL